MHSLLFVQNRIPTIPSDIYVSLASYVLILTSDTSLGLGLDICCLDISSKTGMIVSVLSQTNCSGGQHHFHSAFMAKEQSFTFFPISKGVFEFH